jgi:hypothetical protein
MFKGTGLTLTSDDLLTILSDLVVRVPLPDCKTQHVYVCVAYVVCTRALRDH